jgi:hypothetical protein
MSTTTITIPAGTVSPDQPEFQILVRESEVDIRRNYGTWTPIGIYGGSFETTEQRQRMLDGVKLAEEV